MAEKNIIKSKRSVNIWYISFFFIFLCQKPRAGGQMLDLPPFWHTWTSYFDPSVTVIKLKCLDMLPFSYFTVSSNITLINLYNLQDRISHKTLE
jgi:hypothetical protein